MFFRDIGLDIDWVIPNRFIDGYGFTESLFDRVKEYDLIITVDNGISSLEASKLCRDADIDLIITDHHIVPDEIPIAHAIVNQKQKDCKFPYGDVCGAQIAWYLIASLKISLNIDIDIKRYLPFVAIAVVADMVPLLNINRAMVKFGIKAMDRYTHPPIEAIIDKVGKGNIDSDRIAFFIAPASK